MPPRDDERSTHDDLDFRFWSLDEANLAGEVSVADDGRTDGSQEAALLGWSAGAAGVEAR
jgi:hypothetical protein